jgi:hypothetical protein
MRGLAVVALALSCAFQSALAQKGSHVRGYTTKRGTYVAPHTRSLPNQARTDNYGSKGNVNPYTGKVATRSVEPNPPPRLPPVQRTPPRVRAGLRGDPLGNASAQCRDGTYSFSAHRRGTCSHHGGVAAWLRTLP